MITKKITYTELPIEVGKTYQTKFSTKEKFLVTEIITKIIGHDENKEPIIKVLYFFGIYETTPHLGTCPLNAERLIPEKVETGFVEICNKCKTPLDTKDYE
jgi:hypothetical protein